MDNGKVAEFGTPLDLFNDTSSIFHSMCLKSNISYEEIVRAGKEDDDL
jgi:ATP-binding cassette subfamily C (CFTR/MRP) protein 1